MTKNSAGADGPSIPQGEHPAAQADARLLPDCDVRRQRRSGPGGQHRNKVETAVVITHQPTGVQGEASERRSQEENRRRALFRLRVNLALSVRSRPQPPETPITPSSMWRSRCQDGKIRVNPAHADFPPLLAEALDAISQADMDASVAASWLECTSSQLIRLLQLEPRAIELVNRTRKENGKSAYR